MKTAHLSLTLLCALLWIGNAQATVYFDDGGTHTIDYIINDNVEISGTGTQVTLKTGGWAQQIRVEYDGASFSMTGGYVDWLIALSSSPMFIQGGIIGNRLGLDSTNPAGDVTIYGSDFAIDGQPVSYGVYDIDGRLSGTLANGDILDVDVNCSGANEIILLPIPEPATISLLAIGGIALLRKRK